MAGRKRSFGVRAAAHARNNSTALRMAEQLNWTDLEFWSEKEFKMNNNSLWLPGGGSQASRGTHHRELQKQGSAFMPQPGMEDAHLGLEELSAEVSGDKQKLGLNSAGVYRCKAP